MSEKAKETEEDYDLSFTCPSCNKGKIIITKTNYQMKDGDQMLIIRFACNTCDYVNKDIIPYTTRTESGIIKLKVSNENDLKSKIYRSPTGKLEIPELEVIVEPGPSAQFYFTNVQGILFRFERAVRIHFNSLTPNDPEYKDIEQIINDLENAKKGLFEFTLIITDYGGGSYIIPEDESKYSFEKIDLKEEHE